MPENDEIKVSSASDLEKMFHSFCMKVMKTQILKQLLCYLKHGSEFVEYSLDRFEEVHQVQGDLPFVDKVIADVDGDWILTENEKLAKAVEELREKKRDVLLLNVAEGYTLQETAELLGLEYGSVRVYKCQAIKELRRKLEGQDESKL